MGSVLKGLEEVVARIQQHSSLLIVAGALLIVAFYFALRLWRLLPTKNGLRYDIVSVLVGVPHEKVSAWHHIRLGVLLVFSLGLFGAVVWTSIFGRDVSAESYVATVVGVAVAILALPFTIWTLYQTKRLERLQGEPIQRFDQLILSMTRELNRFKRFYEDNKDRSLGAFRICLVTNNPYFGVITFHRKQLARDFELAFQGIAACIRDHRQQDQTRRKGDGIRLKLVCGDMTRMQAFNARYFENPTCRDAADVNDDSERFVEMLINAAGAEAVVRIDTAIREAQYAVIGDVVYEFILDSPHADGVRSRGSDIRATTRIEDKAAADRFERFTLFLEALSKRTDVAQGNGAGASEKTTEGFGADMTQQEAPSSPQSMAS